MKRKPLFWAYLLVAAVYAAAFAAGVVTFNKLNFTGALVAMLAADVVATIVVWLCGIIFNNASLYDPYWSVAPVIILLGWLSVRGGQLNAADVLLIIVFSIWGVRLTLNWALSWRGLSHQDWRYTMLRQKNPKLWFAINLMGINMFPTLIVFAGMFPAYYTVYSGKPGNLLIWVGAIICISAALLQLAADRQMGEFRSNPANSGKCMDKGLWGISRHPNYLGEISFWWGIWVIGLGTGGSFSSVVSPVLMTALFVFVSIPMMEKHLSAKPGYDEYRQRIPMLLPLPSKVTGVKTSK